MALLNCPECNGVVSNKAKKCPHCGLDIETVILESKKKISSGTQEIKDSIKQEIENKSIEDRQMKVLKKLKKDRRNEAFGVMLCLIILVLLAILIIHLCKNSIIVVSWLPGVAFLCFTFACCYEIKKLNTINKKIMKAKSDFSEYEKRENDRLISELELKEKLLNPVENIIPNVYYDVVITSVNNRIQTMSCLCKLLGITLDESGEYIEKLPNVIIKGVTIRSIITIKGVLDKYCVVEVIKTSSIKNNDDVIYQYIHRCDANHVCPKCGSDMRVLEAIPKSAMDKIKKRIRYRNKCEECESTWDYIDPA